MNYDPEFEQEFEERPRPTVDETVEALKQGEATGLTATIFYGLADLDSEGVPQIRSVWETLDAEYRAKLTQELVDIGESNFDLDYTAIAQMALEDDDARVRASAVELFWTDETIDGMRRMMELALEDDDANVRAAASSALGRYILLGEYEELPEAQTSAAVDVSFSIFRDEDEDVEVRRRALEALSHSSRDGVTEAIRDAYNSHERSMRVSAVFAMGKSYDEKWSATVMRELNSSDPELRYEAARAAGELELLDAVPKLSRIVYEPDREIKEVAIWALGEIGGREATRTLQRLLDEPSYGDEDLQDALEDALMAANMPGSDILLFEYDKEDEDDQDDWVDWVDDEDEEDQTYRLN